MSYSIDKSLPTKIILHAGAHKTGTTLIQTYLHKHLHHPKYFYLDPEVINASGLLDYIHGTSDHAVNPLDLARKSGYRNGSILIISHESLLGYSGLQAARLERYFYGTFSENGNRLRNLLPDADINIVFYIRRQDDFIVSIYLELLATVSTNLGFNEFLSIQRPEYLSWLRVINDLVEVFGADHVSLGLFDEIKDGPSVFISKFLNRIGLPVAADQIPDLGRQRPSFSQIAYELAAIANRSGLTRDEKRQLFDYLRNHFSNRTHPSVVLLPPEQKNQILSKCYLDNQVLFEKYFECVNPSIWYPPVDSMSN